MKYGKDLESDLFFDNVVDIEGDEPSDQKSTWEINLVANFLRNKSREEKKQGLIILLTCVDHLNGVYRKQLKMWGWEECLEQCLVPENIFSG